MEKWKCLRYSSFILHSHSALACLNESGDELCLGLGALELAISMAMEASSWDSCCSKMPTCAPGCGRICVCEADISTG